IAPRQAGGLPVGVDVLDDLRHDLQAVLCRACDPAVRRIAVGLRVVAGKVGGGTVVRGGVTAGEPGGLHAESIAAAGSRAQRGPKNQPNLPHRKLLTPGAVCPGSGAVSSVPVRRIQVPRYAATSKKPVIVC